MATNTYNDAYLDVEMVYGMNIQFWLVTHIINSYHIKKFVKANLGFTTQLRS